MCFGLQHHKLLALCLPDHLYGLCCWHSHGLFKSYLLVGLQDKWMQKLQFNQHLLSLLSWIYSQQQLATLSHRLPLRVLLKKWNMHLLSG